MVRKPSDNKDIHEEAGEFCIEMHYCPSKGRLINFTHITHCDLLYRGVLEPLGYTYNIGLSKSDQACCTLKVKKDDKGISEEE